MNNIHFIVHLIVGGWLEIIIINFFVRNSNDNCWLLVTIFVNGQFFFVWKRSIERFLPNNTFLTWWLIFDKIDWFDFDLIDLFWIDIDYRKLENQQSIRSCGINLSFCFVCFVLFIQSINQSSFDDNFLFAQNICIKILFMKLFIDFVVANFIIDGQISVYLKNRFVQPTVKNHHYFSSFE